MLLLSQPGTKKQLSLKEKLLKSRDCALHTLVAFTTDSLKWQPGEFTHVKGSSSSPGRNLTGTPSTWKDQQA